MRQPQGAFFAVVPKQHGAWTVLIASFIIGSSVGARFSLEVILLLVSVIAAFLGRGALGMCSSLSPAERRTQGLSAWIMLYFGLFLLTGAWLVFWYKLRLRIIFVKDIGGLAGLYSIFPGKRLSCALFGEEAS